MSYFIENFEDIPWKDSRDFQKITEKGHFETGEVNEEYFAKWKFKVLRTNPLTSGVTRVLTHKPGWDEPNFGYHMYTEEAIRIVGEGKIPDESYTGGIQYNISKAMSYTYRPPGWVHDGSSLLESTFLLTNDGPATHIVAPADMVGKNALFPNDLQKAIGPRGYVMRLQTSLMSWIPLGTSPAKRNYVREPDHLYYKLLSKDSVSQAESLLVKYDIGITSDSAGMTSGEVELFVIEGNLRIGDKKLGKYGYAYMPKGYEIKTVESSEGCVAFVKDSSGTWLHE